MEKQKYITLEVEKLEDIIINSINKVYGSHIGYITKQLKEALIENSIPRDLSRYSDDDDLNETIKLGLESSAKINKLYNDKFNNNNDTK
jgi:hypothetical protein